MKVSVIVPVYNGEKFIKINYESFLAQDFDDFELIYVNDGSEDNSKNILEDIIKNTRLVIKLINQENKGVCAARNAGLAQATGDYISFCDVDDFVRSEYLSYSYKAVTINNATMCICKAERTLQACNNFAVNESEYNREQALEDYLYGKFASGVWTLMFKRSVLVSNGLVFKEGYKYSEDVHMVWRMLAVSDKIIITSKQLYIYNEVAGSVMSKFNNNRLDSVRLMQDLYSFFDDKAPKFSLLFKKYAVAKMYWSISWQAAVMLDKKAFFEFCKQNNIKEQFKKLQGFGNKKVRLSAKIGSISLHIFRILAIIYGKKYTH